VDRLLYSAYHANQALIAPVRLGSRAALRLFDVAPESVRDDALGRRLFAASTVVAEAGLTHTRPEFATGEPLVDGDGAPVEPVVVDSTPFASLVHFRRSSDVALPKVLLAAPLSGHFATMLAPTVRTMLLDHDVYITDWHNARDVSIVHGRFGLDEYVDHLIRFLHAIGPGAHVVAVCQPCVPATMAVALLAQDDDPVQPRSLTLMSGPIDTRANPTRINRVGYRRPLSWYRRCLTTVPRRYEGAGRLVYPGFLQIGGFMSLNLRRHLKSQLEIYRSLARGDEESTRKTRDFYAEYFAVLDIAGEFYLDTVERVFQKDLLARGEMTHRGRLVDASAVHRTALLTIEAERDDMCAPGQTAAAHDLFTGIEPHQHRSYVQPGVGHYGIFAGSRWSGEVYPVLKDFISAAATNGAGS
jgi:poly(3-hydroxybutyrate) depolymerase